MMRVVQNELITNTNEIATKGLSQMFLGQDLIGRTEGDRRCIEQQDTIAPACLL